MQEYSDVNIPPSMDHIKMNFPVFSRLITLGIWDNPPPGYGYHDERRSLVYVGASIVIICFGIDNPYSLARVKEIWEPEVRDFTRDTMPAIILVGCKMDVRTDPVELEWMRRHGVTEAISVQEGREMAKSIGAAIYLECSAKTGEGVDEVFHHAARLSQQAKAIS
ncbi:GTP-binding protein Rho1 [Serendipita sp. 411]|nr:GTP-binding protein Rho1 [Serendipita sp. 411]